MSVWMLGLGLSAGYLINKNLTMQHRLQERVEEYNSAAEPSTSGLTSREIRAVKSKAPDAERYLDMNLQDLEPKTVKEIQMERLAKTDEVAAFEGAPMPIEGVWLPTRGS